MKFSWNKDLGLAVSCTHKHFIDLSAQRFGKWSERVDWVEGGDNNAQNIRFGVVDLIIGN